MKTIKSTSLVLAISFIGSLTAASANEQIYFGKAIYPILQESCLSCHAAPYKDVKGRTKKPRGGVRLDTPEWIQKGFLNDDDEQVAVVVPGDAEASSFYTLTILAEDHDDIMPVNGDPLTKEQTDSIKQWINDGAKYGDFKAPKYVNPKSAEAAK
ncbi:MAG: c-type cytochrome domain-containing protein [Lentimonas sp.]